MPNPIHFYNPTALDPRAFSIFGLSAKESDNPIGYFGTGLKYAIAVVLRTGGRIRVVCEGRLYTFTPRDATFRGTSYQEILMECNGITTPLPYTTELGKNWKPWQAFRELYSNALDEGGDVTDRASVHPTIISVWHDEFPKLYSEKEKIIRRSEPDIKTSYADLWKEPSSVGLRSGIRAIDLPQGAMYLWGVGSTIELTEDRTIKHAHSFRHYVEWAISEITDEDVLENLILAPKGTFEYDLSPSVTEKSAYTKVLLELGRLHFGSMTPSAQKIYSDLNKKTKTFDPVTLTSIQEKQLSAAKKFLLNLDLITENYEILVVKSLGQDILGLAKDGKIYISTLAFDRGTKYVAGTILEEHIHLERLIPDTSRMMQNFLIDRLVSLGERMLGEPL